MLKKKTYIHGKANTRENIQEYLMLVREQWTFHIHTLPVMIQTGVYNLIETKVPVFTENHKMYVPFTR